MKINVILGVFLTGKGSLVGTPEECSCRTPNSPRARNVFAVGAMRPYRICGHPLEIRYKQVAPKAIPLRGVWQTGDPS